MFHNPIGTAISAGRAITLIRTQFRNAAIDNGTVLRADVLPEFSAQLDMIDRQAAPLLAPAILSAPNASSTTISPSGSKFLGRFAGR